MLLRSAVAVLLLAGALAIKPLPASRPSGVSAGAKDDAAEAAKWRLPSGVTPIAYDVALNTHVDKFADEGADFMFEGTVVISLSVDPDEGVDVIVLHKSPEMTITTATLAKEDGSDIPIKPTYVDETNKLTLTPDPVVKLSKGNYKLSIVYSGVHGDDMHGFYRSSYVNSDNKARWLVTTQFESYDARRAFPCFDEPALKAKYTISVKIAKSLQADGYQVLSNMPVDTVAADPNDAEVIVYKFKESAKKISSYLVAFIVSDFQSTEAAFFEGATKKEFRTWAQSGPIKAFQGNLSQLAGPAALDVLADLTKVNFGYPKVDQVGIPDFNAGAMENWGLVTYRERLILYDEKIHPISQKQSVVSVTTHELAHQWFGDLVTLYWWSDIWLNEGFATFFEYHASDKISVDGLNTSTWKFVSQMVVDELQANAFATDAQPNSRALTTQVYSPGQIDANFDDVAYAKGGSVIRMWMHTLGEENFYTALKTYLEANTEMVGKPELLLGEFDKVVPDALKDVLKPSADFANWHAQAGYPVLHVKRAGNQSVITQERYLVSGDLPKTPPTWTVPITVTTSLFNDTMPLPENVFKSDAANITISHDDADWVLFNVQQSGFYRVNYDAAGWEALTNALIKDHSVIDEINRAQILDDAMWLARSTFNYSDYGVALNITKYLVKETELIPWKPALNGFNFLYGKLASNANIEPKLKKLILNRIEKIFETLTLTPTADDAHTTRLLRPLIASLACRLGQKMCIDKAQELFKAQITKGADDDGIHPDVKSTVVCTGIRESEGADTWKSVWDLYQNATDNAEQTIYLAALGCSKDADVVMTYLNKTLEPEASGIRRQDLSSVFSSVYNGNPENVAVALEFLANNLETIALKYGGMDPLGGLLTGIASKLGSDEDVKKITELKETIDKSTVLQVHNGLTGAVKAVDIVTANKAWLAQKQGSIQTWLDSDDNDTGAAATSTIALLTLLLPTLLALKSMF